MDRLLIIDGMAVLHRAFHALPPLTASNGEPINAVYGFVSMIVRLVDQLNPKYFVVAFDEQAPTFRHDAFAGYQSKRPETDKDLASQFDKARQVAVAMAIPVFSLAGYEADDVIGTIVDQVSKGNPEISEVIIVTGDRDIFQLVGGKVKMYMPSKGMSEGVFVGEADVVIRMGVTPAQIPDYKALVGDSSDDYPGVTGIGPKGAGELLRRFGSFDGIYTHLDEIKDTMRSKLVSGKDMGVLSYKLATIVKDVPVTFDAQRAASWNVYSDKVLALFKEYGFRTLTSRVAALGKKIEKDKQPTLL